MVKGKQARETHGLETQKLFQVCLYTVCIWRTLALLYKFFLLVFLSQIIEMVTSPETLLGALWVSYMLSLLSFCIEQVESDSRFSNAEDTIEDIFKNKLRKFHDLAWAKEPKEESSVTSNSMFSTKVKKSSWDNSIYY